MRIGLFGGSFNPPHLGHVLAACYARIVGGMDEIWVLPVAHHAYAKALAPWTQRLQLCALAFAPLGFVRVRDDELGNGKGYTIDLFANLSARHPGHHWLLIGGSDTAADMQHWHRGAELARQLPIFVVPRAGHDSHPMAIPGISSTQVRDLIMRGGSISDLVPPAVAEAITRNGWYGAQRSTAEST